MIDILHEIHAIGRKVTQSGAAQAAAGAQAGAQAAAQAGAAAEAGQAGAVTVTLTRTYPAGARELWSALTEPERLERWFLPITGELKEGGSFQLIGNASGEILTCSPPEFLRVSFGGPESIVELRIEEAQGSVELILEHTVPLAMAGSGAGSLYVGPGWDGALMAVGLYLAGQAVGDPVAAANSPEGLAFSAASIDAWLDVVRASGTADEAQIAGAEAASRAQFTPNPG